MRFLQLHCWMHQHLEKRTSKVVPVELVKTQSSLIDTYFFVHTINPSQMRHTLNQLQYSDLVTIRAPPGTNSYPMAFLFTLSLGLGCVAQ